MDPQGLAVVEMNRRRGLRSNPMFQYTHVHRAEYTMRADVEMKRKSSDGLWIGNDLMADS